MPIRDSVPCKRNASTIQRQHRSYVGTGGNDRTPSQSVSWKTTTPPGRNVHGKLAQHRRRITLKHEDVPANDGVERPLERHLGGIALAEEHVPYRAGLCSRPCCLENNSERRFSRSCRRRHKPHFHPSRVGRRPMTTDYEFSTRPDREQPGTTKSAYRRGFRARRVAPGSGWCGLVW
jgi:hypothetical protein